MSQQLLSGVNVQATITVKPEHLDTFLKAFQPIFERMCSEAECLSFEVFQSTEHPGVIHLTENWYVDVDDHTRYILTYATGANPSSGSRKYTTHCHYDDNKNDKRKLIRYGIGPCEERLSETLL
jgi:hypothetical protein